MVVVAALAREDTPIADRVAPVEFARTRGTAGGANVEPVADARGLRTEARGVLMLLRIRVGEAAPLTTLVPDTRGRGVLAPTALALLLGTRGAGVGVTGSCTRAVLPTSDMYLRLGCLRAGFGVAGSATMVDGEMWGPGFWDTGGCWCLGVGILEGVVAVLGLGAVGETGRGRSGFEDTRIPVPTKNLEKLSSLDDGGGGGPWPMTGLDFASFAVDFGVGDAAAARRGDGEFLRRTGTGGCSDGLVGRLAKEDFFGLGRGIPKMWKFFFGGC